MAGSPLLWTNFYSPPPPPENWHVTEIRPFGMNPCPRRRVGCATVGGEILICGGTSPVTVVRDGKEREILHDHNDVFILHLGTCVCIVGGCVFTVEPGRVEPVGGCVFTAKPLGLSHSRQKYS